MPTIIKALLSPRLFRIHGTSAGQGRDYEANSLESFGDRIIKWVKFCWSFSYWTSPALLVILYKRDAFTWSGLLSAISYGTGVSLLVVASLFIRAAGRVTNADYVQFMSVLREARAKYNPDNKRRLSMYDCEFSAWPVFFDSKEMSQKSSSRSSLDASCITNLGLATLPCNLLSYIAAHTFGVRMVYPGATALIQTLMDPVLRQGRAKMIEVNGGLRRKILTEKGRSVDTMFVDRRNQPSSANGNVLVLCCEGNSGFYEVGCCATPLDMGYSVLGWNHPGFGGSSGQPFPEQEQEAMDTVMQYAIHKLGFAASDIILFAWSIGGYTASWAAMTYPDIRHIVLDATFDDLLPLAVNRMPRSWKTLVVLTIRKYLNLNIAEHLCKYQGPVLLIRRSKDEMITTVDPTMIASNRGNDLLIKLLQYRYPKVINDSTMPYLREWLAADKTSQVAIWLKYNVSPEVCSTAIQTHSMDNSPGFPSTLGDNLERDTLIQLTLYLASRYMEEFDSTHCTPLPPAYFKTPWDLTS